MTGLMYRAATGIEQLATRAKRRADRRRVADRRSLAELEADGWRDVEPVFVLSTGRCGTRLLSDLLEVAGGAAVHHAPRPELIRVSRRAYEEVDDNPELFTEVIKTAREELLWDAVRYGHRYVETNNRVTFLAPAIERAFPGARYLHLVRHPADIVRSGIRRGWYQGEHAHELGRIRPVGDEAVQVGWERLDPIGRIGWLWNETNAFVERFLAGIPEERQLRARAEDLFADPAVGERLLRFCGVQPLPRERIAGLIARPVNAQRSGDFPAWPDWSDEQRASLRAVAPLAQRYGYEL